MRLTHWRIVYRTKEDIRKGRGEQSVEVVHIVAILTRMPGLKRLKQVKMDKKLLQN